jgi:hypothetical protein
MNLIVNFGLFHLGWLACVIGAASNMSLLGSSIAILLIAVHLYRVANFRAELYLIVAALVIGLIWESLLLTQNWLAYAGSSIGSNLAPYWLVIMWALFATTINISMAWIKGRWLLAVVMGAVFGPMAFIAGEKLGAVEFLDSTRALIALSFGWAILMPLILWISDRINRSDHAEGKTQ